GPTGVGKTEIARRLATLANAPFVKVEATRFTEVGYVGKDVEQIIRDLADTAVKMYREQAKARVRLQAEERAEERILDALLPRRAVPGFGGGTAEVQVSGPEDSTRAKFRRMLRGGELDDRAVELELAAAGPCVDIMNPPGPEDSTRAKFRRMLRDGELDDREIELELAAAAPGVDIMTPPGMEEMGQQLKQMFASLGGGRTHKRTLTIRAARPQLIEEEAARLVNEDDVRAAAIEACEQHGIVFID